MDTRYLCIDCAHCKLLIHDYVCLRTERATFSPVTGAAIHLYPRPCTYERSPQGECGLMGQLWKAKDQKT